MDIMLNIARSSSKPMGVVGRIFLSLFFLIFLAAGACFTFFIVRDEVRDVHIHGWLSTPCTILSRSIENTSAGNYKFTVSYRYQINGQQHIGHEFKVSYQGDEQYYEAQKLFDQYPPEMQTMCLVDAAKPDTAYLVAPNLAGVFFILFPLIFVAIGIAGIVFAWRVSRPRDEPLSATNSTGKWQSAAFFIAFFLAGMGMMLFWIVPMFSRAIAARSWPQVPCTVISSRVQSHSGDDGSTYSVDVLYEYRFTGHRYRSNRYDLIGGSSSGTASKQQIVSKLPTGAHTVCYVDPLDPAYAAIDRELGWSILLGLFPIPFILVGVGGLWFGVFRMSAGNILNFGLRRWNSPASASNRPWPIRRTNQRFPARGNFTGTPVVLASATSRIGKLIAITLVAAFWNGIVGVFIHGAYFENGGLFLKLFLIPFILVGIGLIVAIGYTFLQLFNPRIRLTVSRDELKPGETADLSWQFTGRSDRINHLTIRLEGKESTTYQNGEDTKTDHHVFANVALADVTRSMDIHSGKTRLTIPAGTMHTLLLPSNKITWSLIVQADIPRWPDVKETFPVSVIP